MKRLKLILICLVISIFSILTGVLLCACGGGKVDIVGWEDLTEQVKLGDCYQIKSETAKDKDGNDYLVTVNVYRINDGKEVSIIFNSFDIVSIDGYKVIYSATDKKGEVKATKTITLNVEDIGNPIIMISGNNIAEVGTKFNYPQINISDDSGSYSSKTIEVYDEQGQKIDSDDIGFIPDKIGYYTIKVKAEDSVGNKGESEYKIYARRKRLANEIDCFDDLGFTSTTYSLNGAKKEYANFSTFKMNNDSLGSAYFISNSEKRTSVYTKLRNSSLELRTALNMGVEDTNLCATIYIADKNPTRKIFYGNTEIEVRTNTWVNLIMGSNATGNMLQWINRIDMYDTPIFEVENTVDQYILFIDKIVLCESQQSSDISGLKEKYEVGESLTFNISDAYKTSVNYQGIETEIETGYIPENNGEYILTVKSSSTYMAEEYYYFTVGDLSLSIEESSYISKGKTFEAPELLLKDNGIEVVGVEKGLYILSGNGEFIEMPENYKTNDPFIVFKAQGEYAGNTIDTVKIIIVNKYAQNAWFSLDGETFEGDTISFYKDYVDTNEEHLSNVLELKVKSKPTLENENYGESFSPLRNYWNVVYSKEYYEQFEYLVFKIKASVSGIRFAYIGENPWGEEPWHALSISNDLSTEWKEYKIKMSDILDDFDNFAKYCTTWLDATIDVGSGHTYESIFISDIYCEYCEKEKVYSAETWFNTEDTDSVSNADTNVWRYLDNFDNETGVVQINMTGDGGAFNRVGWKICFDEEHYSEYDYIVFKAKADKNVKFLYGEEPDWYFPMAMNLTTEWKEFKFSLASVMKKDGVNVFDKFASSGFFYCEGTEGQAYQIYVSSVIVEKSNIPATAWFNTYNDACLNGASDNFSYLETYGEETGVVKISTKGEGFINLGTGFAICKSEDFYKDYDNLVFRIKANKNVIFSYGEETDWYFPMKMNLTTEWQEIKFKIDDVIMKDNVSVFNNFLSRGGFYCEGLGSDDCEIYISEVYVEKELSHSKMPSELEGETIYTDPYSQN